MQTSFRSGILRHQTDRNNNPIFLKKIGGNVSIIVSPDPTVLSFIDGTTDYLYSINTTVNNAWNTAADGVYLYWKMDRVTGLISYESTTYDPVIQSIAPSNPSTGQLWFDTLNKYWYEFSGGWQRRLIVFATKVVGTSLTSMSGQAPVFRGSQVGINTKQSIGSLVYDKAGVPLQNSLGQFFTTESNFIAGVPYGSQMRIEALATYAIANNSLAAYSVVRFNDFNNIVQASSGSQLATTIGIVEEDADVGERIRVIYAGPITNENWDWTTYGVDTPIYVANNGTLSPSPGTGSQLPVARVIGKSTILFEPWLGTQAAAGSSGVTDHGLLEGLGDNDHPQYQLAASAVGELSDLSDVDVAGSPTLVSGMVLTYNGVKWDQQTPSSGTMDHTALSNIGTNTHAQIDTHIATGSPIHYLQSEIDHNVIQNVGTNTHAQIDIHIATGSPLHYPMNAISITESQVSDLQSYLLNITGESIGDLSDVDIVGSPTLAAGMVLTYSGTKWAHQTAAGGGLQNVVEDLTPQLGGDLDVNGNDIVGSAGASGGHLNIKAGTGTGNGGTLRLYGGVAGTGTSGGVFIANGPSTSGRTGDIDIFCYGASAGNDGGDFSIKAGDGNKAGNTSGNIEIAAGNNTGGDNGFIELYGQPAAGSTTKAGEIRVYAGSSSVASTPGADVKISSGSNNTYNSVGSGGNIQLTVGGGGGGTSVDGAVQIVNGANTANSNAAELHFYDYTATTPNNYVGLKAPDSVAVSGRVWALPQDDPSSVAGQFLTTDASGNLSFDTPAGGVGSPPGITSVVEDTSPQLGGNLDVNGNNIGTSSPTALLIEGYNRTGSPIPDGVGGTVQIYGGAASGAGNYGGYVQITSGSGYYGGGIDIIAASGSYAGGNIGISAGYTQTTGPNNGGYVQITGGQANYTGGGYYGGAVTIQGGGANNNNSGGAVNLVGGNGNGTGNGGTIYLQPGSGTLPGNVEIATASTGVDVDLRFIESGVGSEYVALKAPTSVAASRTWVLPQDDPSSVAGQFLTTDASGNLSFDTPASGGSSLGALTDVTLGSPITDNFVLTYNSGTNLWGPEAGGGGSSAYDIVAQSIGVPTDGDIITRMIFPRAVTVAASGHVGWADIAPTGGAGTVTVYKATSPLGGSPFGTVVGTLVFNNGSNTLSSETISGTSFAAGDMIYFEMTSGNSMGDLTVTVAATTD